MRPGAGSGRRSAEACHQLQSQRGTSQSCIDLPATDDGAEVKNGHSSCIRADAPPLSSAWWDAGLVADCATESDMQVLEFLAKHDYDTNRAWHHFSNNLSHGKGRLSQSTFPRAFSNEINMCRCNCVTFASICVVDWRVLRVCAAVCICLVV